MDDEIDLDAGAVPELQREEYVYLRGLAALRQVHVVARQLADGGVAFHVGQFGVSQLARSLEELRSAMQAAGVPLLSRDELQRRAAGLAGAFEQGARDATAPNRDQ